MAWLARTGRPRKAIGLRLRLTLTYVGLFSLLIGGIGLLFRQTLSGILREAAREVLAEEWAAVKGFLRIEQNRPVWLYNSEDREESFAVQRLRRVFLIADAGANVLEVSPEFAALGLSSPQEIRAMLGSAQAVDRILRNPAGVPYLVRSGVHLDDGRHRFALGVGRSLAGEELIIAQFTARYFALAPLLVLATGLIGWIVAGRALQPLNLVAATATAISGDDLSHRIPRRGSDDELDHLIDRFNAMVDRLERAFNQVRQFSIDASHELRTPLTAIRGQLEVALMTASSPENYREAIIGAIEDVDRLSQVVRSLLLLGQAESGRLALNREELDLAAVAQEVCEQFRLAADDQGIALETRLAPGALLAGDRVQLERLLSNLLSNALKFTPAGGRIDVAVTPAEGAVELAVQDTGCGIPPEHLPHIFERFYRVPEAHSRGERGLGLGLSFVAWIAGAHGARIHVDSCPGRGSRFIVSFPAAPNFPAGEEPAGDRMGA